MPRAGNDAVLYCAPAGDGEREDGGEMAENAVTRVAVVPGDGIGVEVTRAGVAVMQAATRGDASAGLEFEEFPWGCEYYLEHGRMMPEDALETLAGFRKFSSRSGE